MLRQGSGRPWNGLRNPGLHEQLVKFQSRKSPERLKGSDFTNMGSKDSQRNCWKSLWEMQILGPHPRPLSLNLWKSGLGIFVFNKIPQKFPGGSVGYGSGIVAAVALDRSLAPGLPCSLAMAKKNTEECLAHGISLSILCLILQIRSRSRERRLEKAQGGGPAPRNQFSLLVVSAIIQI